MNKSFCYCVACKKTYAAEYVSNKMGVVHVSTNKIIDALEAPMKERFIKLNPYWEFANDTTVMYITLCDDCIPWKQLTEVFKSETFVEMVKGEDEIPF